MKKTTKKNVVYVPTAEEIKATEAYLAKRRADAEFIVLTFNNTHRNSLVYLKLTGNDNGAFQIHFKLDDVFINQKYYDDGSACIYTSDALYKEIQRIAGDHEIDWNNTGSIGWLSYRLK